MAPYAALRLGVALPQRGGKRRRHGSVVFWMPFLAEVEIRRSMSDGSDVDTYSRECLATRMPASCNRVLRFEGVHQNSMVKRLPAPFRQGTSCTKNKGSRNGNITCSTSGPSRPFPPSRPLLPIPPTEHRDCLSSLRRSSDLAVCARAGDDQLSSRLLTAPCSPLASFSHHPNPRNHLKLCPETRQKVDCCQSSFAHRED